MNRETYVCLYIVKDDRYCECLFDVSISLETNIRRILEMAEVNIEHFAIYDPNKKLFLDPEKTADDYALQSYRCLYIM